MSETPQKGGYISQAWLVILLALLYGGALAGVQTTLGPIIAENKRNETYQVIPKLVPGADREKTVELTLIGADGKDHLVYKAMSSDGVHQGWVVPAGAMGFADRIELLIGLDAPCSLITGIKVLDQKETPGLGNFIAEEPFESQFAGKTTSEPISVVKTDPAAGSNQIRALTGATISSESVADIVNNAVANLREAIVKAGSAPAQVLEDDAP